MTENQSLQRWRCLCAYDGTEFNGWQKQTNREAVQDKIELSLGDIFGCPIRTIGAGRTDAGVHADGQVFHFDASWKHSALQALRFHPRSVWKSGARVARFHAHLSARENGTATGFAWVGDADQDRYVHSSDQPTICRQ